MHEDISIRAIVLGASMFIILTVFSLVMSYYGAAKDTIQKTDLAMTIESTYVAEIDAIMKKAKNPDEDNNIITGTQVKNLINYYYGSDKVLIQNAYLDYNSKTPNTVNCISLLKGASQESYNLNNYTYQYDVISGFDKDQYKLINNNINPNAEYVIKCEEITDANKRVKEVITLIRK